ncbi:MAG: serine/threonine-protein kinase [Acidimicrobiales bacterium]
MNATGIADYVFVQHLGAGNHGEFWLATPPARLGRPPGEHVAVKTLAQRASDNDFARMANELRVYASITSPFLLPVLDAGHQNGRLFYATPYCPDGSLGQPARPLGRGEVRQAAADAGRAAHELHQAGVAHRDIKPSNILLAGGRGHLSDLGLAQVINPGQTVTGIGPVGTIEYLSPEVVRGDRASRASDIWALGVTLHRVLTGRPIYQDLPTSSLRDALRQVLQDRPLIDAGLSEAERAVIARCLALEPADRYPTAEAFADDVERIAD